MRPLSKAFRRYPKGTALIIGTILYGWCFASTHADDNTAAEIVAEWDFGAKEDVRRDGWPDDWTRRTGQEYPKFIPIGIYQNARTADDLAEIESFRRFSSQCMVAWQQGKWPWQIIPEKVPPEIDRLLERTLLNPYLRIQMDGGAVEVSSPMVEVDIHSVYFMTALIHCDSEDYDASAKLRFLDSKRAKLFEMPTKAFSGKTGWKAAATESQYSARDDIAFVQAVVQVRPKTIKSYRGEFGFDAIRILRTPRLSLSVDRPLAYYRKGEDVIARCTANGMTSNQTSIKLVLHDHTGKEVDSVTKLFVRQDSEPTRLVSKRETESKLNKTSYWDGSCEWQMTNLQPGYYEITTQLTKGKSGVFELDEQFCVMPLESQPKPDSRFGWTMSSKNNGNFDVLDTMRLIDILRFGQVGRVKLPVWYDSRDAAASKSAIERIDRVQLAGITCVGVIATPPPTIRNKFTRLNPSETASALEDSLLVQSFLEPVMSQMCARISDFQIGWDHETDFLSNPRLKPALEVIKNLSRRYGQEAQIIAAHNPLIAASKDSVIDRWQLYSSHPFTARETESLFGKNETNDFTNKTPWLNLTPLNATKYSLSARVQDLAARMLSIAGELGTQNTTAWVSNPADPDVGVLDSNGGPREMLLPFRSMAVAIAGKRQVGSLPIPSLGENYLLVSGDEAKLIAWSARPTTPQLYLGEDVSAQDVWGRTVAVETIITANGPEQRLTIGKWPVIIRGIDSRVAKLRMGIKLEETRIDPIVGQAQELKVRVSNPLSNLVIGQLKVIAPTILAEEASTSFELDQNSIGSVSVPLLIRPDANTSSASIKLAFAIQGEKPVTFVVDQEIQVGTSDFEFEVRYEIDSENQIRLLIAAINHQSSPLSFDCVLLIPNRPRARTQIAGLVDRVSKVIVLENASELTGKTLWLRCEQISTNRVLNYRIEINP